MSDENSPVKKAAYFFVFMLMAALLMFWKAYYPYYKLEQMIMKSTESAEAVVIEAKEPIKEDYYYYGPIVEFTMTNGIRVRSEAVSPMKTPTKFRVGDKVTIRFNGEMNTDVVISSDDGPRRRCVTLCIVAGVIALIGLVDFAVNLVTALRVPKGKTYKFDSTPDGMSFEEWRHMQKFTELADSAEKELSEEASGKEE